jgi:hypothetical protein
MREQEVEVMEPQAIVELLGKTALFGTLAEVDRAAIAGRMRRVQFDGDQMIFSRGDPGRDIYLVMAASCPSPMRVPAASSARSPPSTAASARRGPPPSPASRRWRCRSGR